VAGPHVQTVAAHHAAGLPVPGWRGGRAGGCRTRLIGRRFRRLLRVARWRPLRGRLAIQCQLVHCWTAAADRLILIGSAC
jgi:hypothetical protein